MAGGAPGEKLGRLASESRQRSTANRFLARIRAGRRGAASHRQAHDTSDSPAISAASLATGDTPEAVDVDLIDALARAEAAEAQVVRLRAELMHKEEVLAEAHHALRTARLALRDQLRITEE